MFISYIIIMQKQAIYLILLLTVTVGFSQTTTQDGAWITGATWGGTSPGYSGLNTPIVAHDVESASDLTFANSNGRTLTISTGGVLVVRGDILFNTTKNNAAVVVQSGATLIVFGSVELGKNNAGITVEAGGVVVVTQQITAVGNNGTIAGEGKVYTPSTDLNDGGIGEGAVQPIDNLDGDGFVDIENYVNDVEAGGNDNPLPVELIHFKAIVENNVLLQWATASEINNDHFSIERSEDGEFFYEIGQVEGNGNTNEVISYSFKDALFLAPVEYYRLKQVDFNGEYEYFHAIRVETDVTAQNQQFMIFPNLVKDQQFNIKSNSPFELKELTVYGLHGGSVINLIGRTNKQNQLSYQVSVSNLMEGIYFLNMITTSGKKETTRLIIK